VTDEFRHRTRVEVRFRDIDAFGHVNNAVFASYTEQARVSYLRDVLAADPVGRMPLILAMLKLDFVSPIMLGETVEIGSRVDWMGRSSIAMSHRLASAPGDRDHARVTSVLVTYDYDRARPMPIPDDWRATLTTFEGRTLERPQGDA
jgi:acyl-CoA thioester hydrolase